jgi:hypothetical protein
MSNSFKKSAFDDHFGKPPIYPDRPPIDRTTSKGNSTIISSIRLQQMVFEEPLFVIPGLIPHGCTILAGSEKVGKSLFATELALAIAGGRKAFDAFPTDEAEVLYVMGEGNLRDMQDRCNRLCLGGEWPAGFSVMHGDLIGVQAIKEIRTWATLNKDSDGLIVVDTLQAVNPPKGGNKGFYERYYPVVDDFTKISNEFGIPVLIIHHTTREKADNPFDRISGGRALGAAADTMVVVEKDQKGLLKIFVRGRSISDLEATFELDESTLRWICLGDSTGVEKSSIRQTIANFLRESSGQWFTPKEMSQNFEYPSYESIKKALPKMSSDPDSEVITDGRGKYRIGNAIPTPSLTSPPSL